MTFAPSAAAFVTAAARSASEADLAPTYRREHCGQTAATISRSSISSWPQPTNRSSQPFTASKSRRHIPQLPPASRGFDGWRSAACHHALRKRFASNCRSEAGASAARSVLAMVVVLINAALDLTYGLVDPRLRAS